MGLIRKTISTGVILAGVWWGVNHRDEIEKWVKDAGPKIEKFKNGDGKKIVQGIQKKAEDLRKIEEPYLTTGETAAARDALTRIRDAYRLDGKNKFEFDPYTMDSLAKLGLGNPGRKNDNPDFWDRLHKYDEDPGKFQSYLATNKIDANKIFANPAVSTNTYRMYVEFLPQAPLKLKDGTPVMSEADPSKPLIGQTGLRVILLTGSDPLPSNVSPDQVKVIGERDSATGKMKLTLDGAGMISWISNQMQNIGNHQKLKVDRKELQEWLASPGGKNKVFKFDRLVNGSEDAIMPAQAQGWKLRSSVIIPQTPRLFRDAGNPVLSADAERHPLPQETLAREYQRTNVRYNQQNRNLGRAA